MAEIYLKPPRDEHGNPVASAPAALAPMSATELHKYRCFLLDIMRPDLVALAATQEKERLRR